MGGGSHKCSPRRPQDADRKAIGNRLSEGWLDWYKPQSRAVMAAPGGCSGQGRTQPPMARNLTWSGPLSARSRRPLARPRLELIPLQPGSWLEPACEGFPGPFLAFEENQATVGKRPVTTEARPNLAVLERPS